MNERIDNLNNKILPNQNLENLSPFMSETDYQDEQEREFLQDDHTNYLETTSWELILEIFNEFLFGYDKSRVDSHGDLDHHHEFLMLLKLTFMVIASFCLVVIGILGCPTIKDMKEIVKLLMGNWIKGIFYGCIVLYLAIKGPPYIINTVLKAANEVKSGKPKNVGESSH